MRRRGGTSTHVLSALAGGWTIVTTCSDRENRLFPQGRLPDDPMVKNVPLFSAKQRWHHKGWGGGGEG